MSRIILTQSDLRRDQARKRFLPIVSIMAASTLSILPIIAQSPILPDFGFLVFLAWRLLRPTMWQPTTALAFGFFNDLVSGHPLGQSMALWTGIVLLLDLIDTRNLFRDYWMDWLFAAMVIILYITGGWYIARLMGSSAGLEIMVPQMVFGILAWPLVSRLVIAIDRWRLG